LLDVEQQMQGMSRRSSIYNRINEVFAEDWRSEEEIRIDMIKPDAVDSKRQIRHV
jgi:DNA sulfur modification protein DndC